MSRIHGAPCASGLPRLIGSPTNKIPLAPSGYLAMNAPRLAPVLTHGLSFNDLYDRDGLGRLDAAFAAWLQGIDAGLHARLMAARTAPDALAPKDESNLLIE